jgi:hypothetical protein
MDDLEALVAQVPEEILNYIEDLETRVEKAEAAVAPEGDDEQDAIAKALNELPEGVADLFKSQRDRLEEAEKALEAERVAKADTEWIAKARAFDGLVDSPEDFGRKLRQVAETDSELADEIAKALSAANEQVTKSSLFSEVGHNTAPAAGSAEEKISTIAKSLQEADPAKSKEQAEAEAWEMNPELYEQHVAERQQALRGGN